MKVWLAVILQEVHSREGEQPPKHDDLPKAPKPDPDPVHLSRL